MYARQATAVKPDYENLDYVSNQYKMAVRHNNWERAYLLEERMKEIQQRDYGCTWTETQHTNVCGEVLVTIIIN